MKYKAIVCDVDGTFVQIDEHVFPLPRMIEKYLLAE
jgi:hydroxymethylpyrimidine pyrophosphatase-like HAD family hydrolase